MHMDTLIYDVGAHRGDDTQLYLEKGFSVIAIEAVPELCDALSEKFNKYVVDGQLKILNVGISAETTEKWILC